MKTTLTLVGTLALASSTLLAQDQPFQLDHFKCYFPELATPVQPAPVHCPTHLRSTS